MTVYTNESVLDKIAFLRKGDAFLLKATIRDLVDFRTGVTAMDGHSVSDSYGWAAGYDIYDDLDRAYINVKFDDTTYPNRFHIVNQSVYARPAMHDSYGDGMSTLGRRASFELFVDQPTFDRIARDSKKTPEELHPKLVPAPEPSPESLEIAKIEEQMKLLQERLEVVRTKV